MRETRRRSVSAVLRENRYNTRNNSTYTCDKRMDRHRRRRGRSGLG